MYCIAKTYQNSKHTSDRFRWMQIQTPKLGRSGPAARQGLGETAGSLVR